MPKRVTTEIFTKKAKQVHGNIYSYDHVNYVKAIEKVAITCPKHGDFLQTPNKHLSGCGCPTCNGSFKKTNEKFIKDAIKIHGNKYDYSKIEYKDNKTKICIICPEHGEFWQTPSSHLSGNGCSTCGIIATANAKRSGKDEFVAQALVVHGGKYDYSNVIYENARTPICIICPKHGEFWQTPDNHLHRQDCPECSKIVLAQNQRSNIDEFITKANSIHSNQYDYSKSEYKTARDSICIICPEHGEFWQTPDNHLHGQGCPYCKSSAGEKKIRAILEGLGQKFQQNKYVVYRNGDKGIFDFRCTSGAIEFDGIQHFKAIDYFGGQEGLRGNIVRDNRKNSYCKEHDVSLLRIRYDQIDDIEAILSHFIENPDFYKARYNPVSA